MNSLVKPGDPFHGTVLPEWVCPASEEILSAPALSVVRASAVIGWKAGSPDVCCSRWRTLICRFASLPAYSSIPGNSYTGLSMSSRSRSSSASSSAAAVNGLVIERSAQMVSVDQSPPTDAIILPPGRMAHLFFLLFQETKEEALS